MELEQSAADPSSVPSSGKPTRPRARLWRRVWDLLIVVSLIGTGIYLTPMIIRVSDGYTKTLAAPDAVVRLDIVNASGDRGLGTRAKNKLSGYTDRRVEVAVVADETFAVNPVMETFVISRDEDLSAAKLLAITLGLDPTTVVYRPLDNNIRCVSATLVLGQDATRIALLAP